MFFFGRILGRAIDIATALACIAVVLMMVQITVDVAGKYLFNSPMPATIAIVSNYYMVLVAFLPLALAERRNEHISVELVTELMPKRVQQNLYSGVHLFSAVTLGLLAYSGWQESSTKQAIGAFIIERGLRLPVWFAYYVQPIGCALLSLTLAYRFLVHISGMKSGLGEAAVVDNSPPAELARVGEE